MTERTASPDVRSSLVGGCKTPQKIRSLLDSAEEKILQAVEDAIDKPVPLNGFALNFMDEMVLHAALAGILDNNNGYLEENLQVILATVKKLKNQGASKNEGLAFGRSVKKHGRFMPLKHRKRKVRTREEQISVLYESLTAKGLFVTLPPIVPGETSY
jgi:hypothetical protein